MKYNYLTNTIEEGSPGAVNLATRIKRARLMFESRRWDEQRAVDWLLRDFPYAHRIMRAR